MTDTLEKTLNGKKAKAELDEDYGPACDVLNINVTGLDKTPEEVLEYLNGPNNPLGKDWMIIESGGDYIRFVSGKFDVEHAEVEPVVIDGEPMVPHEVVDGVVQPIKSDEIVKYRFFDAYLSGDKLEVDVKEKDRGSVAEHVSVTTLKKYLEDFLEGLVDE